MNEFDTKAEGWDMNPMHFERSEAIAKQILERIPLRPWMKAMEFGAGTGITSFLLKDHLNKITMMDNSPEMVRVMNQKIRSSGASNLSASCFDLEKSPFSDEKFDLILTQMVLHHVNDVKDIIGKFFYMLNPGGYLAVADLYSEDGSFHEADFTGHKGFDTGALSSLLEEKGFRNIHSNSCFTITKQISPEEIRQFDLFLLTANKI
ncbi:MAG: class I SAM-dependent methyltransferase [Bacteroidales bacterium]